MNTACGDEDAGCVLHVAADHPAFAGHFPGAPVLPGAVLLDEVLSEIERSRGIDITRWRITAAKFLGRVLPGDELTLRHCAPAAGTIRFTIGGARGNILAGSLTHGD
jgi:3-hydroxymyristoyl/3-hydroxydecanoyl-(acyl carrier protein) dehydratase